VSIQTISPIITALATVALVIATILLSKRDFNYRKKQSQQQATIDYYHDLSNNVTVKLRKAFIKATKLQFCELGYLIYNGNKDEIRMIPNVPTKHREDVHKQLFVYYRNMEHFAVAIRDKLFDDKTFYSVGGETTLILYKQTHLVFPEADNFITHNCKNYKKLITELEKVYPAITNITQLTPKKN
jgi:hypothetical protein